MFWKIKQKIKQKMKTKANKSYEIDMTNGSILPKILLFSLPLIASGVLQLLFNAADVIVVGQFAGKEALAAVGSTSSLTNLIVNVFIGLSIGANVMVARYYGAKRDMEVHDTVHTSIVISLLAGIMLIIIGFFASRPMLSIMGTPSDVIEHSVLYMRIYFAGMPVLMLYNFGAAILRAVGDTRRPLYYLSLAGFVNVLLNLIFVIVFKMGVAGVALATVLSQAISAILVLKSIMTADSAIKLNLKELKINWNILAKICRIGFPAGIQGAVFSISNVLIQSSINSFGANAMAGSTAAQSIEGFVYTSMNAVHQTTVSFVGQNAGAKRFDRIKKIVVECFVFVTVVGLIMGNGGLFLDRILLGFYSGDSNVIELGHLRLSVIMPLYCLCGIMEIFVGGLRGLSKAIGPTIISLLGACAFRVVYIYTYFAAHRSLEVLYLSYPISWILTSLVQLMYLIFVYKNEKRHAY